RHTSFSRDWSSDVCSSDLYLGVDFETGDEFDSSWSRGESINFPLGSLIAGWQEGIPGMKVGGRRQLVVPPHLAYGPAGAGHQLQHGRASRRERGALVIAGA